MPHLISYDIENDSLRQKIANKIIAEGFDRVQYSVYLGGVSDGVLANLITYLKDAMLKSNLQKDNIIIISLTDKALENMLTIGQSGLDIDEIIGNKNTLIF